MVEQPPQQKVPVLFENPGATIARSYGRLQAQQALSCYSVNFWAAVLGGSSLGRGSQEPSLMMEHASTLGLTGLTVQFPGQAEK